MLSWSQLPMLSVALKKVLQKWIWPKKYQMEAEDFFFKIIAYLLKKYQFFLSCLLSNKSKKKNFFSKQSLTNILKKATLLFSWTICYIGYTLYWASCAKNIIQSDQSIYLLSRKLSRSQYLGCISHYFQIAFIYAENF